MDAHGYNAAWAMNRGIDSTKEKRVLEEETLCAMICGIRQDSWWGSIECYVVHGVGEIECDMTDGTVEVEIECYVVDGVGEIECDMTDGTVEAEIECYVFDGVGEIEC
jgi:hypothetical protein